MRRLFLLILTAVMLANAFACTSNKTEGTVTGTETGTETGSEERRPQISSCPGGLSGETAGKKIIF